MRINGNPYTVKQTMEILDTNEMTLTDEEFRKWLYLIYSNWETEEQYQNIVYREAKKRSKQINLERFAAYANEFDRIFGCYPWENGYIKEAKDV